MEAVVVPAPTLEELFGRLCEVKGCSQPVSDSGRLRSLGGAEVGVGALSHVGVFVAPEISSWYRVYGQVPSKCRFLSVSPTSDIQLAAGDAFAIMGKASINPSETAFIGWVVPRDGLSGFTVEPAVTHLDEGGDVQVNIRCSGDEGATIPRGQPIAFVFVAGHDILTATNRRLAATLDTIDKRLVFLLVQYECGSNPLEAGDLELIDW